MKKVNILVSAEDRIYRLFSIMHATDTRGEPYLKLIVPNLKSTQTSFVEVDKYINPIEQESLFASLGESQLTQAHELTYHYISGVIHFKNTSNNYIGQTKKGPNILKNKFILVSRLVFNTLERAEIYKKKIKEDSILLQLPFNHLGRLFEVYITSVNLRIENDHAETLPLMDSYKISITDSDEVIVVNEYSYFSENLIPKNISFSWFLPNKDRV